MTLGHRWTVTRSTKGQTTGEVYPNPCPPPGRTVFTPGQTGRGRLPNDLRFGTLPRLPPYSDSSYPGVRTSVDGDLRGVGVDARSRKEQRVKRVTGSCDTRRDWTGYWNDNGSCPENGIEEERSRPLG